LANRYRDIPQEEPAAEAKAPPRRRSSNPRRRGVLAKALASVFSGTFLGDDKSVQHLPFVLFLAFLAVMYIANGYYADDKIREANRLSNELKELRSEYISTKSELMFAGKQSEVAKAAARLGLKEPVVPPVKILVDSAALNDTE
jgi:hypothetical protein